MATRKPAAKAAKKTARKAPRRAPTKGDAPAGFTAEERAAMKERARELKAARGKEVDGEQEVLDKIAAMAAPDRAIATRIHELVKATVPELGSRTWYGMPAYTRDGRVVCFFQERAKFKARYTVLGFSDRAHLDDGPMWPTTWAIEALTPEVEAAIVALLKKATS